MSSGEVPGRLGASIASNVYTDPYGNLVPCTNACSVSNQGYVNCADWSGGAVPHSASANGMWTHIITVWRNFEPTQMYRICMKNTTKCLGVVNSSTADGANVELRTYNGGNGQNFAILQTAVGKYKIINVNSNKALSLNGTQLIQKTFAGTSDQVMPIVYFTDQPGNATLSPDSTGDGYGVGNSNDGTLVQTTSNLSSDMSKWYFTAVGAAPAGLNGGSSGTGPCASFCTAPILYTAASFNSGDMSSNAVCYETTASLSGGGRYNMANRTFKINGQTFSSTDGSFTLPSKVNGGYCFQATAGGYSYASFNTW
jgi:hypothetical protein